MFRSLKASPITADLISKSILSSVEKLGDLFTWNPRGNILTCQWKKKKFKFGEDHVGIAIISKLVISRLVKIGFSKAG